MKIDITLKFLSIYLLHHLILANHFEVNQSLLLSNSTVKFYFDQLHRLK